MEKTSKDLEKQAVEEVDTQMNELNISDADVTEDKPKQKRR